MSVGCAGELTNPTGNISHDRSFRPENWRYAEEDQLFTFCVAARIAFRLAFRPAGAGPLSTDAGLI